MIGPIDTPCITVEVMIKAFRTQDVEISLENPFMASHLWPGSDQLFAVRYLDKDGLVLYFYSQGCLLGYKNAYKQG